MTKISGVAAPDDARADLDAAGQARVDHLRRHQAVGAASRSPTTRGRFPRSSAACWRSPGCCCRSSCGGGGCSSGRCRRPDGAGSVVTVGGLTRTDASGGFEDEFATLAADIADASSPTAQRWPQTTSLSLTTSQKREREARVRQPRLGPRQHRLHDRGAAHLLAGAARVRGRLRLRPAAPEGGAGAAAPVAERAARSSRRSARRTAGRRRRAATGACRRLEAAGRPAPAAGAGSASGTGAAALPARRSARSGRSGRRGRGSAPPPR